VPDGTTVTRVELWVNGQRVQSATQSPYAFATDVPAGAHSVRARVVYRDGSCESFVESPNVRNPWWPYGGPARQP
jgi:hypothetical protein